MARTKLKDREPAGSNDMLPHDVLAGARSKSKAGRVQDRLDIQGKDGKEVAHRQRSKNRAARQREQTSSDEEALDPVADLENGNTYTTSAGWMASRAARPTRTTVPDKDAAELELERAVFGDSAGFKDELKTFGQAATFGAQVEESDGEDDATLEHLPDDALFFTDTTGNIDETQNVLATPAGLTDGEASSLKRKQAWEDSDDDRIAVSLASVPRLRKLRISVDEDVVNGKEYIRRLQKQYMILNPTPAWVLQARELSRHGNKRRRLGEDDYGDDSDDIDNSDQDDELPSARPLTDLLRSSSSLLASTSRTKQRFRPTTLAVDRQPDIGPTQPSSVENLTLHPTLPLLLTSGGSGTIYLHHLSSSPDSTAANPLLTTLHVTRTPLTTTIFHPTAPRILFSGRRRYLHAWDLASGKVEKVSRAVGLVTSKATSQAAEQRSFEKFRLSPDGRHVALQGTGRKGGGVVNVLDSRTWLWRASVRIDSGGAGGGVADFCWWSGSGGISVLAKGGEVTEWDLEGESVAARWNDQGAVGATVIRLGGRLDARSFGPDGAVVGADRWVAVGSASGIVNLYDRRAWYEGHGSARVAGADDAKASARARQVPPADPEPHRALDHLTTPASALSFSPDGQLLAISSRWKRDALRLVHTASGSVYSNWPTSKTPLGRVTATALGRLPASAGSGAGGEQGDGADVLVVGNESGKVRLWELRP